VKLWRGFPKKVTPEMKRQMRVLRAEGYSYDQIASASKVCLSTVRYHIVPREGFLARKRVNEWRRRNKVSTSTDPDWRRTYMRERYRHDKDFKKRMRSDADRYQQRIKERNRKITLPKGTRLTCPYCFHEWNIALRNMPSYCPSCGRILVRLPESSSEQQGD